jgi:hemerythrin-like domain-containing protein
MQPIKDLKMEHDAVQMTLRILDKICQRIEKLGEIIDRQNIDQLLEFFKVFVDKCHHGKEE